MAAVAGIALAEGSSLRLYRWEDGDLPVEALRPVQALADVVAAVLLVLVLPRHASTRAWAAGLAVPMAVLPATGLQWPYRWTG